MKILTSDEQHSVHGAEILSTIATVGAVSALMGLTIWLECYALKEAQDAYDAIDFNTITPEAAYELGYRQGLMSCHNFYY